MRRQDVCRQTKRMALVIAACVVTSVVFAWASPAAEAWTPEAPTYGTGEHQDVSITASDGTVLYANVYYPTDLKTGEPASGPFPVLLNQSPYGKDAPPSLGGTNDAPYFADRGYIYVITDERGTGVSEGNWGLLEPQEGIDGAEWVNYVAKLPNSNGDVGLVGESYLGIDQFATAADAGPTHVKAMFPVIPATDLYRDTAFAGGFFDQEFAAIFLGLVNGLNVLLPASAYNPNSTTELDDHVHDVQSFDASLLSNIESGGDAAYAQSFWGARDPNQYIAKIAQDHIPAFLIGGWYDIFLRGELRNYAGFQNAYDNRPVTAPMTATQPVTSRYQLLMGPWYHSTAPAGVDYHGLNLDQLYLAWFDHWLKGVDTGITDTTTPMHLEDLATGQYHEASRYPLDQTTDTTYYLQPSGGLSTSRPTATSGADPLAYTGSEIPCTASTEQWAIGEGVSTLQMAGIANSPCTTNASLSQVGPGTQSYTTAPFTSPTTLAGPISASIEATTTTTDAEWVVQLSDVAPDGTATSLTSGLLEGNQRALDSVDTWYAPDGNPILPWHPYTQAAQTPITPGKVTQFDVEVFPAFDTLEPGHRLRVTIATSDFPHVLPTAHQLPNLAGGVYEVERNSASASSVELPLAPANAFATASATPLGCPAATGTLSGPRLGPARLGLTQAQTRQAFASSATSSTRGRQSMVYYCLNKAVTRVGFPSGALLRSLTPRLRSTVNGRAVLALTTSTHYVAAGARPGMPFATISKRIHVGTGYRVGSNTWYLLGTGPVRDVLKVHLGTVAEIGVANGRLLGSHAADARFVSTFT